MMTTCLITHFLIFILLLNLGALDVQQGLAVGCHDAEREALLKFKHSLRDPSNRLSSWKGKGCCDWEGVGCHNVTAFVNRLDLPNPYYFDQLFEYISNSSFLIAPKLDPSLLELKHLNYLDLSCNDFQGSQIPKFIGGFKYLRYLNLSHSNFSGSVPSNLGNLTRLRTLDLFSYAMNDELNYLSSDLQWVSKLVSLQYLDFGGNHILFDTNSSRYNMPPSLLTLHLSECQNLSNPLLLRLFSNSTWLSRIQQLDLSGNSLGYVLANMTSLRYLAASIPMWLGNMTSLTYLDLSFNGFNGSIPMWLGNMTSLTYLDLSFNELNGSIPLWLGNMTSLTHLATSFNYFTASSIPLWLRNLTFLTYLELSHNNLNGSIPMWLGNMTSLTYLDLSNNGLNGSIPLSMSNMKKLEHLDLSFNSFSSVEGGAIMGILGNLCNLITFDLSHNSIGGRIETNHNNSYKCIPYNLEYLRLGGNMIEDLLSSWMGDFKYLRTLDISHNKRNGDLPSTLSIISSLSYLEVLDLSSNALSGALLESHLDNLSRLYYLDLSFNVVEWNITSNWSPPFQLIELYMTSCKIQSQFPPWIAEQTKLWILDLSDNNISGELPQYFTSNQLHKINISHNQITGPVPSYFSSDQLDTIDLSFNLLSGSLVHHDPSAKNDTVGAPICQIYSLAFLDLQKNNISGGIADCWAGLEDLAYINLSSNNLSGIIPLSMGLLSKLAFLKLSNNSLHGPIPPTLSTSSSLHILDLSENKLVGNIPSNWGGETLPMLELLRLRRNQLVGPIPPTLCSIQALKFIDFSFNNLIGGIPHCFGRLLQMESSNVLHMDGPSPSPYNVLYSEPDVEDDNTPVVLKGAELHYTTTLKYVVNLDLSCNALTGTIPEEITNLSALIGLNLSHNHLTGNIPNKIGEMTSLESLDISNNNLSGIIPSSLSVLTSLESLNLSYNKLHGQIPTGRQLQTLNDPSIYEGNPGLCGDPLPNRCRTNHGENQPIQGKEKSDVWEKPVLYLVIMSGFATGFWGVVGSLLLKRRFRFVFFQVVGNVADYLYVQVMIRLNRLRN